jgi:type I restriction enzyme S subunit
MTDSRLPWLGEIPKDWGLKKMKFIAEITLGKMLQNENSGTDVSKPYLRAQNIQWFTPDLDDVREMWFAKWELHKLGLKKDDLLVSEGGEVGRTAIWNEQLKECFFQNSVNRVRVHSNQSSKFHLYCFFALGNAGAFDAIVSRVSIAHLTREKLKEVQVPVPELSLQEKIVTFLDEKTAIIDRVIAKKHHLIELLKEKRTAIINQAVTKGLDPNSKLIDSGEPWLGKIPKGWETRKLKFAATLNSEVLSENTEKNFLFKYIDIGNVEQGYISEELPEYSFVEAPSRARRLVKKGDTILGTVRTYLKAVAQIEYFVADAVVSTGFAVIHSKLLDARYQYYQCLSERFVQSVVAASTGVSYPAINPTDLAALTVSIPPMAEQQKIATYLDQKTSKISEIIKEIERSIHLLVEYKSSLIHHAVTGKIKI